MTASRRLCRLHDRSDSLSSALSRSGPRPAYGLDVPRRSQMAAATGRQAGSGSAAPRRQLAGRSRVIVQFKGDADVRVFGQRPKPDDASIAAPRSAEVDNVALATDRRRSARRARLCSIGRAFATMERTGLAIGATLARQQIRRHRQGRRRRGDRLRHHELARRPLPLASGNPRARRALQGLHATSTRTSGSNDCRRTTTATARTSPASSPAAGTTPTARARASRRARSWLA